MEEERHPGMVRNLTRNLICFSAAVMLLSLMVCALEVALRVQRLRSDLNARAPVSELDEIIAPSSSSWVDVKPLVDLQRQSGPSTGIHIRTNEHGLRAPSIIVPKPRGTYRILCLGGDNVFGSAIAESETLSGRMQRLLNMQSSMPVEVINAGCPNAGPLINLLRYRIHLSALQPDLVILCLSEEDLSYDHDVRGALHLDETKNPAYASHPALKGQGSAMLDGLCEEFLTVHWLLNWAGDVAGMRSGMTRVNTAPVRESVQRDLAAIVPLAGLVSGQFGHLIVSVSPSAWSVDRARNAIDKGQSSFAEDVRRFLADVHLGDRVEVQDGLTAFSLAPDARASFSPETGGLSAIGIDLYSQQLSGFLLQTIPGLAGTSTTMQAPFSAPSQHQSVPSCLDQGRGPATSPVVR